jgi:hypothetical protein
VKTSVVSTLLLLFIALSFLSTQVLGLVAPAEVTEAASSEDKEEENLKDSLSARLKARGKNLLFADLSAFMRSALDSYPGNLHLLQVFRV